MATSIFLIGKYCLDLLPSTITNKYEKFWLAFKKNLVYLTKKIDFEKQNENDLGLRSIIKMVQLLINFH